jgi:hypothetical protein
LRRFGNRVVRRLFGPRREEVEKGERRLHNLKRHDINAIPYITRVIKSRRMRWAEHVTCIGAMRNSYTVLVANVKGRVHSEDLG